MFFIPPASIFVTGVLHSNSATCWRYFSQLRGFSATCWRHFSQLSGFKCIMRWCYFCQSRPIVINVLRNWHVYWCWSIIWAIGQTRFRRIIQNIQTRYIIRITIHLWIRWVRVGHIVIRIYEIRCTVCFWWHWPSYTVIISKPLNRIHIFHTHTLCQHCIRCINGAQVCCIQPWYD